MVSYQIRSIQTLKADIEKCLSTEGIKGRSLIASTYEAMMNTDLFFPARPKTARRVIYRALEQKVSDSCPSCYSSKEMLEFVISAKQTLREYKVILIKWLSDNDQQEPYDSVHDLSPTI